MCQVAFQARPAHHRGHLLVRVGDPAPGPLAPGRPGDQEQGRRSVRTEVRHTGDVGFQAFGRLAESRTRHTPGVVDRVGGELPP